MSIIQSGYRAKSLDTILRQCIEQQLDADVSRLTQSGYVVVSGGGASVYYNPATGNFIGTTPEGVRFQAAFCVYAELQWFRQLVEFFHESA